MNDKDKIKEAYEKIIKKRKTYENKKPKDKILKKWFDAGWDVDVEEKPISSKYPKGWFEIHPKNKEAFEKAFGVSYVSTINY